MFFKQDGSFNLKMIQKTLIVFVLIILSFSSSFAEVTNNGTDEVQFPNFSHQDPQVMEVLEGLDAQELIDSQITQAQNTLATVVLTMRIKYIETLFWLQEYECLEENSTTETCNLLQRQISNLGRRIGEFSALIASIAPLAVAKFISGRRFGSQISVEASIRPRPVFRLTRTGRLSSLLTSASIWTTAAISTHFIHENVVLIKHMSEEEQRVLLQELRVARSALQVVDLPTFRQATIAFGARLSESEINQTMQVYRQATTGGTP